MIGEVFVFSDCIMVQTNKEGTLEKLPKIKWYQTLFIYFLSRVKNLSVCEVREYCNKKRKK